MNLHSIAKILVNRPKTVLLLFTIIAVIVGSQISNVYMESDFSTYLPRGDPRLELWDEINKEFNLGSTIIVLVETEDLRDPDALKEIDRVSFSDKINPWEYDEGKDDGIVSVRSIAVSMRQANAGFTLSDLAGDYPADSNLGDYSIPTKRETIDNLLRESVVKSMKGVLYTSDYKHAVILIQLAENANYDKILENTTYAINHKGTTLTEMTITGTVAMQQAIQQDSMQNLVFMFPIALVFVSIVLFIFHRTLKGILIAFFPPAFALVLTFGVMGIVSPQLTIISVAIVALLMGLGVDYSIHIMNRLTEESDTKDMVTRVEKTLKSTGKAVLLSTITTMIGFGSLMISSMSPMVTFGFGCAIGILFCLISAVVLVPCLVVLLDFKKKASIPSWKKFAYFIVKNRHRIMVIAIFFVIMSLLVVSEVETDVNYLEMAPEDVSEVDAMYEYSDIFGGGANFNALLVETDYKGLEHSSTIEDIYEMENKIRDETKSILEQEKLSQKQVVVTSIADPLYELSQTVGRFNITHRLNNLAEFLRNYSINAPTIEVEKIMFDRIAEENLVDDDHSKTMILVSIPVGLSIQQIQKIVDKVNEIAQNTNIDHGGRVSILTGQDAINVAVNKKLGEEQTRSMIVALLFVLTVLILIFSSSKYGFLTMIPVVFVLSWEPGFLYMFDISLSVVTISIASIMIGIGIDYGIHITQRIREGLTKGLNREQATVEAIEKTGLSLIEATTTTVAGLASIYFINIPALREFGLVVIIMTALSCIAAALILPVFFCSRFIKIEKP